MSSFTRDSSIVEIVRSSGGVRKNAYLPRVGDPQAHVIHTTGAGPWNRIMGQSKSDVAWRKKRGIGIEFGMSPDEAIFEAALWVYSNMAAGPHFVLGQHGVVAQVCPIDLCAWHVGGSGAKPYLKGPHREVRWAMRKAENGGLEPDPRFLWWKRYWTDPALDRTPVERPYRGVYRPRDFAPTSPIHLAGGQLWAPYTKEPSSTFRQAWANLRASYAGGSCNANTIGYEVCPPARHPTDGWSPLLWAALGALVQDVSKTYHVPHEKDRVIRHSDAHPLSRTTKSGAPWDPRNNQFTWFAYDHYVTTGVVA